MVYFSVYVVCFDISFNLFSSDFYNINVFSGIPGSAKSALCKELLNAPGGFGDDRPVHTLMGDLVKGILECRFFLGQNCSGLSICYAISCNILHTGQENIGQRLLMNVVKNHNRLCWLTKMPQMKMSGDR